MTDTWGVIDLSCLLWQEFHGAAGRDAAASVIGSASRARDLLDELGCQSRGVWCLDRAPYLRSQQLGSYKASRTSDPDKDALKRLAARLPQLLATLGYRNVCAQEGYEADDHVAAAVIALTRSGTDARAVIISRDKDLHQLLGPRVTQLDPMTRVTTTAAEFRAKFGLHPSEYADVKAITGCTTDEVPGVPGVGEITAAKYLRGDLQKIGATWGKIRAWIASDYHKRNESVVRLPYPGTNKPALTPDVAPRAGAWDEFTAATFRAARETKK